jgi:hypothetical protein
VTFSFSPLSLSEVHRRRALRAEPTPFSVQPGLLYNPERDENDERPEVTQ